MRTLQIRKRTNFKIEYKRYTEIKKERNFLYPQEIVLASNKVQGWFSIN